MNHQLDQEVVVGFISEAKGYLPEIMLGMESFAADTTQLASLKEAFRYAHIIKGAASMLGFMNISEVAYQLEVTLEMLCEEHLPLSQELLEDLCQNVSCLADLLDNALVEPPMEVLSAVTPDAELLSTTELSTEKLSIEKLSIPELLAPEPSFDAASLLLPLPDFSLSEMSFTPSEYEEKGETILLPAPDADDDILPEARTAWSAFTPSQLEAFETEEPLVALLNETNFSVSLPEAVGTPTIGEVNLNDVAKELKESFGAYPPPLQPEFTLPNELMAGLPELHLATPPENTTRWQAIEKSSTENIWAESASEAEAELPEVLSATLPEMIETCAPAQTSIAEQAAAEIAPNGVQGETFLIESLGEEMAPAADLPAELTTATPAFQSANFSAPVFDEALPELLALPNLPELHEPAACEQQVAVESFATTFAQDASVFASLPESLLESVPEPVLESLPEPMLESVPEPLLESVLEAAPELVTVPSPPVSRPAPISSSMISDDMAEELMETFLLEAEEHLQNLHTSLRVLYKNPNNRELLQEVRRSSHSLKGTAAMVGLNNIMQLAHRMEDVLDLVYDGEMQLTQERTLLLMQATDALEDMSNGQSNEGEVQRLYNEFARVLATTQELSASESEIAIASEPFTIAEPEAVEEAAPTALPAAPDTIAEISEDVSETNLKPVSQAESLLPQWSFDLPEMIASEAATATEAEMLVAEPFIAATTEVIEEIAASNEPILTAPALEIETAPAPMAVLEAAAETVSPIVHEPEVLPALQANAQANAMTQASSQFVRVPIERLDDVVKLISEMIITRTMFEQRLADFAHQVEELQITGTRLRRASSNLESKYEASTLGGGRPAFVPNNAPPGLSSSAALAATGLVSSLVTHNTYGFDDLEFDRYTEFHLVSRELVESSTDIQTLGRELNHLNSDFLGYLNRQGRIYSDLQDRLMRLRMVPLGSIAPRLHRTVRTVAVQQQKEAELILEGDTTAIDTTALQEITDPLLHLLRNAVDHGIETPDVRIAKGKAPMGRITLRAFYEGSQVVIQLRDDGKGLDLNRIRNRALQHALITSAEAESMSAQELWALIFTPGFSTAETISEISGRGVGMDVVHTMVQKLKGTIIIDSQPNAGTTFTIRLPLTLAVTRSLMVKANGQTFAIPLDVVTQIMRLEMSKVERIGNEPVVRLGGKVYPLLMLSRLLNIRQSSDDVSPRPPALLLSVEGKEVVVIVDQLMGGREVVIKTLGSHLRKIHGVMGATLMGDGEVVLILNFAELLRGTVRLLPRRAGLTATPTESMLMEPMEMDAPNTSAPKPKALDKILTIMIVDDSPSVRRVSSNMIKNIGWISTLAKDGLDALEQLQASETPPDLILLDIEMPRMDGYQFLGSLRSLPAYRNLPVVIVSSRSSEKHRQKAFDLGATEYLVKPYQEDNVITLIRRLVRESHQ